MPMGVGTEERARLDDDSSLLIESRLAEGVFAIISFASIIFLARALPGVLMTCKGGRAFSMHAVPERSRELSFGGMAPPISSHYEKARECVSTHLCEVLIVISRGTLLRSR